MKYEQITQTSRFYKYGEGEEYANKEEARKSVEQALREVKTELAMQRLYDKSEAKIVEADNAFQIVVKINVPKFV